ncbi:MAG: cytochrome c [Myxococcales bacterium]|nr:cytochrome c [Myxococcales bacterium]
MRRREQRMVCASVAALWLVACRAESPAPPAPAAAEIPAPTAVAIAAPAVAVPIQLKIGAAEETVTIDGLRARVAAEILETPDPQWHGQKRRYRGVPLLPMLATFGGAPPALGTLTVVCADGFRAQIPARQLATHHAVLAWGEADADGRDVPFGRFTKATGEVVDPGPFYIVWDGASVAETFPWSWPYQVIRIEVEATPPAAAIDPDRLDAAAATPAARAGFAIFSRSCVTCHAVNGVGGLIGPELGQPMNITRYFARPVLEQFILDWQKVRAPRGNEKMPRFVETLSPDDVRAVVDYLAWMADRAAP